MNSLYAQYFFEREGRLTIELDFGFVNYTVHDDHLFIHDLFIAKPYRNQGLAPKLGILVNNIAKDLGLEWVKSYVCLSDKNWWRNKNYMRKDGYKFDKIDRVERMLHLKRKV